MKIKGRGRPTLPKNKTREPVTVRLPLDIRKYLSKHDDSQSIVIERAIKQCDPTSFKCSTCHVNFVDAGGGYDTCRKCIKNS